MPLLAAPYVDARWVLAARSSSSPNCTDATIAAPASPVTRVEGLGFGVCTYDWIVSLKRDASAARWKAVNIDTVSENMPPNGTSFLVASEQLSLWSSTASAEWHLTPPPDVNQFRAYVRLSPTRRSIAVAGLELGGPYTISYRPLPLRELPPALAATVKCPRHQFSVTRVNVSMQGRLVGLRSECDLVRGGFVVFELHGESHVRFRTDFAALAGHLRRANNCSASAAAAAAASSSRGAGASSSVPSSATCTPKWWAHASADWSDFSLDKAHRVLRFKLRMTRFVPLRDLDGGADFFEGARVPLAMFRGLTGAGSSSLVMAKSGVVVAPVAAQHVRIFAKRDNYGSAGADDVAQQFATASDDSAAFLSGGASDTATTTSTTLAEFDRFLETPLDASEYDVASGNMHFNVTFASDVLRPVAVSLAADAAAPAWTNFTSCPVLALGVHGSHLRGHCTLYAQGGANKDKRTEARDGGGASSHSGSKPLLTTQVGAKYDYTIDHPSDLILKVSKRSLCGLCDRRVSMEQQHSTLRLEAAHLAQQRDWPRVVAESKGLGAATGSAAAANASSMEGAAADDAAGRQAAAAESEMAPLASERDQQQQPQQQQHASDAESAAPHSHAGDDKVGGPTAADTGCTPSSVDFSPHDWVTVAALRVVPEGPALVSSRPVAKQCALAYGLGSFVVQARHGYFLPSAREFELDVVMAEYGDYLGAGGAAPTNYAADVDAFNTIRSTLRPTAFVRNGRQLVVRVNAVPKLQIQRTPKLIIRLVAPNRYFDGNSTVNGTFTLTILRSQATLELFTMEGGAVAPARASPSAQPRRRNLTVICENTLKEQGVIARITLEGDAWHPSVGDGSASGHNIAMINAFYDAPHAAAFDGGGAGSPAPTGSTGAGSGQQQQAPGGSLASPFVSYIATVLRTSDVVRVSNTTVEIFIRPCGGSPACAAVTSFTAFAASELIAFAVPGVATSCPGCLVAQPPVAVLGLAASVQPSMSPLASSLQLGPNGLPQHISNTRYFSGVVPGTAADTGLESLLPRELFLHAICSTWSPPAPGSQAPAAGAARAAVLPQQWPNELELEDGEERAHRSGSGESHQLQSVKQRHRASVNAVVVGFRLVSPTVLGVRIGPVVGLADLAAAAPTSSDGSPSTTATSAAAPTVASAVINVPVDWLYNASTSPDKMTPTAPWLVSLHLDSGAAGSSRGRGDRGGWTGYLRHHTARAIYALMNGYLWLVAFTRWQSPRAALDSHSVGLGQFVRHPVSLLVFGLSWGVQMFSLPGAALAVLPWLVLERMAADNAQRLQLVIVQVVLFHGALFAYLCS